MKQGQQGAEHSPMTHVQTSGNLLQRTATSCPKMAFLPRAVQAMLFLSSKMAKGRATLFQGKYRSMVVIIAT